MAYGKEATQYVDTHIVKGKEKVKPYDFVTFAMASGMAEREVRKLLATYDTHRKAMNEAMDTMLATVEASASKANLLAADMALAPWFNYGHKQVVRVIAPRHGAEKAPAVTDSVANVAALLATIAPATRLIQRRK